MEKNIGLILGLVLMSTLLKAQDSLVVYDINVTLNSQITTSAGILDTTVIDTTAIRLNAVFRLTAPGHTDSIYVKLGNVPDGIEFSSKVYNVVSHVAGTYCMHEGATEICPFSGKAVAYSVVLSPENISEIHWMTVYAKDDTGNYSAKKYFKLR